MRIMIAKDLARYDKAKGQAKETIKKEMAFQYVKSIPELRKYLKNPQIENPYGVKMESWIDAKLTEFATDLIEFDKVADYKAEKKALLDYAEQIADWANITRKKAVNLLITRKGVILRERKNPSYGKNSAHHTNTYKKQLLANYKEALKEAEEKGYESSAAVWRKRIKDIDYKVAKYAQDQKAQNPQTTAVNPSKGNIHDAIYQFAEKVLNEEIKDESKYKQNQATFNKYAKQISALYDLPLFQAKDLLFDKMAMLKFKESQKAKNPQITQVNPKQAYSQIKDEIADIEGDIRLTGKTTKTKLNKLFKYYARLGKTHLQVQGIINDLQATWLRNNYKTKQNALSEYAIYENPKLNFTKPFVEKLAKDKDYATRVWAQKWLKSTGKAKQQADEVLFSRLASIGGIGFDFYRQYKNPVKNALSEYAIYENHIDETLNKHSAMFQGEITGKITKVPNAPFMPKQQSRLGKLKSIELANGTTLDFGDALLSMDIRKNLFITGKDSKFSNVKLPKQNGIDSNLIDLGGITEIRYITRKKHIENGALVEYYHKTGEVTGELPHLFVHNPSKQLYIFGGNYDVWTSGIVN